VPDDRSQAERIYAAERKFGCGGWFCDVADAQAYAADLLASKWWKRRCAVSEVRITYGRRKAFPRGSCDCRVTEGIAYVDIERARLCEQFLIHELSHIIAWPSDHGPAFVSALLDLTHYVFWPGARAQLRQWMRDEGVKFR
jgi:putative metallohydrolase (TIGR04338 family)